MSSGSPRREAFRKEIVFWAVLAVCIVAVVPFFRRDPVIGSWSSVFKDGQELVWVFEPKGAGYNDAIEAERRRRERVGEPPIPDSFRRGLEQLTAVTAFTWKREGNAYILRGNWIDQLFKGQPLRLKVDGDRLLPASPDLKAPWSDFAFTRMKRSAPSSKSAPE